MSFLSSGLVHDAETIVNYQLTDTHIEFYQKNGYLIVDKFLDGFEKFVEVYLIIAATGLIIIFIYNVIIRSI